MRELRESWKASGEHRIYIAAEKAEINRRRVMQESAKIPPGLQKSLNALRTELKSPVTVSVMNSIEPIIGSSYSLIIRVPHFGHSISLHGVPRL